MWRASMEVACEWADPVRQVIYLTEDESDGGLYRFIPTTWGNLSSGTLQVLVAGTGTTGSFTWATVPDPDGSPTATRDQVAGMKIFNGGEGVHYADDTLWFTTKGDNRVWQLNLASSTYELAYDDNLTPSPPLTGVDNITGSVSGDLFVAEDGGNMELCIITPDDIIAVFLRVNGQSSSEITGPAFNPAGNRLYLSSQRGTSGSSSGGITSVAPDNNAIITSDTMVSKPSAANCRTRDDGDTPNRSMCAIARFPSPE